MNKSSMFHFPLLKNHSQRFLIPSFALVLFLFLLSYCSRVKYDVEPGMGLGPEILYHSLKIKVNLKEISSGRKQSLKILLKFTDQKARMLFLGPPLNRVYAKLITDGEFALLINSKKKKYWQGDFKTLLLEIWDIDFSFAEFKKLLKDGVIPGKKIKKRGLKVSVEKEEESGRPGRIEISGRNIFLKLKISNRKTQKGKINFSIDLEKLEKASLEGLLEDDPNPPPNS